MTSNQEGIAEGYLSDCERACDELRAAYQEQVEHNRFAANKHSEHIHELGDRLNELRAENERLRAEVADLLPGMDADAMSISNLAHENERLRARLDEAAEMWTRDLADKDAEIERLTHRALYAERVWKELGASREKLQAENERLRAALEKHHDLLSDEPGDVCRTCALDYLGRDTE